MDDLEGVDADMYRSVNIVMALPAAEVEDLCMNFAIGDSELEPGGMEREVNGTTAAAHPRSPRPCR